MSTRPISTSPRHLWARALPKPWARSRIHKEMLSHNVVCCRFECMPFNSNQLRNVMMSAVLFRRAIFLVGLLAVCTAANAQNYPAKTVRIVVPYEAGGGIDGMGRLIAKNLTDVFERQVIIENRSGGGTIIGTENVARSDADGHTLLLTNNAFSANHTLKKNLPYKTLTDFTPIILTGTTPNILVIHPSLPAATAREFVKLAGGHSGQVAYASAGVGSASHLAMELLSMRTSMKLLHVPYKGTAPALVNLLAGEVQAAVATLPATIPYIRDGRLRALCITSAKRTSILPQVPTLQEAGIKDAEFETWYGLFARTGVPPAIVSKINASIAKILASPDVREMLKRNSIEPGGGSPEAFERYVRVDVDRVANVIRISGLASE